MQNAQVLSQPIWIVTQAAWPSSRRTRQRRGERVGVLADGLLEDLDDRPVLAGVVQQVDGPMHVVRAEDHVDVAGALRRCGRGPSGRGSRRPRSAGRAVRP